jgi:hypothetical protein
MNILQPNQIFLRDYTKIYTGTNQEGGYENPFLGFTTDTVEIILKSDKSTYFHYPNTANQIALSASDLLESGAFAGSIPYRSDRIFKKTAGYSNDTYWGNSLPEDNQRGVWLCAWLSGNVDSAIWMDRWYNPGSLDSTLSIFTCSISAVYDTPSTMTFDPGVWYRYDHIGNMTNESIVNMICGLQVHDDSITTLNENNPYSSILYSTTFNSSANITCSLWSDSSNWQNQSSHHIVSNGLRGGWSIGINNGFFTPIGVLVDNSGNVAFLNQTGSIYKDIKLPGASQPVSYAVDSELYTWILDNGVYDNNKHLYKIDYNGNIENTVYFDTSIELYDIEINGEDIIWVSNNQTYASAFNTYCDLISTSVINNTQIITNASNTLTSFNVTDLCLFENVYYWTIENGNVYYSTSSEKTLFLSDISANNIQCTKDYIWLLFDNNKIARYDKTIIPPLNIVSFTRGVSTSINDDIVNGLSGRNIFFTNEYIDNQNVDYVWILNPSTEYLYKYDTSLNLLQKINTTYIENSIQDNAVKGDSTGYIWHKKYNYDSINVPQIEASVYLGTLSNVATGKRYTSTFPISALTVDSSHLFTICVDTTNNIFQLYIDSILRDTQIIPASSVIFYRYESPLIVGGNVGRINILDEEIGNPNRYFHSGSFNDLRIYDTILNNSDIQHIYLMEFSFKDLIWNMPSGIQSYIEEIVKFFKFKMPGQKSQYYNIRLVGLQIQDTGVRNIIEDIIKETVKKVAPLYTSLFRIIWD